MVKKTTVNPQVKSHVKDLVLLFGIPIAIALFAAAVVYIPQLMANPKYDFVYSLCNDYTCKDSFTVDGGQVSKDTSSAPHQDYYAKAATIHYYNSSSDSTKSLSLDEAKKLRLSTVSKSADGYTLTRDETESGFLFWGDYDAGWYLKNGAKKKKIVLSNNDSYYSQDVKFLGWVEK